MKNTLLFILMFVSILGFTQEVYLGTTGIEKYILQIQSYDKTTTMEFSYDGEISLRNNGNTLTIDFKNDTIKTYGYKFEPDSFALVFCNAVVKVMNESLDREVDYVLRMNQRIDKYKDLLNPRYEKVFKLYLQQLNESESSNTAKI